MTLLRKWLKSLVTLCLVFCVIVTLAVGAMFLMYPRELVDFVQVLHLVRRDFQEPVDISRMLDGAIAGLAEAVDDPYTYYLTPARNRSVAMASQGFTGAIGVTVGGEKEIDDRLVIREVRPNSGAAAAGLMADDAILRVEDTPVKDLTVDEAVAMIRGMPDTYVRLLIARAGEDNTEYLVKRTSTVVLDTVQAGFLKEEYMPEYKIAYIYIDYFAGNSGELFDELLDNMLEEEAEALIIDLRFNGGGDVRATSQIAGRLLPSGELMRLLMRGDEEIFYIRNARPVTIPYVILVNGGSASASEILAGVVQDAGSGIIVGTRTFGKGSVQSVYTLMSGGGLRVTEGKYYLPSGRSVDGEGIMPDYVVEIHAIAENDDQLTAALDLLKDILDGEETLASLLDKSPRKTDEAS